MPSPIELTKQCDERMSEQGSRIQRYASFYDQYHGKQGAAGVQSSYEDGRPALREMEGFSQGLANRTGAPNILKPIIDDAVAVSGLVPTSTFEPKDETEESLKQANLVSTVVRGQWEQSQMELGQAQAEFYRKLLGEVCYTLEPLRPKEIHSNDPFALPGVYINVQDPSFCFPRFGSGRDSYRIQDLFINFRDVDQSSIEGLYPDAVKKTNPNQKVNIVVYYGKNTKTIILKQDEQAYEAYHEDHNYGFCPVEWAINKPSGSRYGLSEISQAGDLHRKFQALFHLNMDHAISSVFPVMQVHNAEHVDRMQFGPGAIINTSEDGYIKYHSPAASVQTSEMLLNLASDNLLKQSGVSPIRVEGMINKSNVSGRAMNGMQAPQEARLSMSNTILGSTLQWVNSKIALMMYSDPEFKKADLSVYSTDFKGQKQTVTFKGEDLGGLWRNHVKWPNLLGGNSPEIQVQALQLKKEHLISGRRVLEIIGEDDPERLIEEARLDMKAEAGLMQSLQGPPQGGPPPGGPQGGQPQGPPPSADGPQPQPGPQDPAPMPGFPPIASAPGSPAGGAPPVPDINSLVQAALANVQLKGQIMNVYGTPNGIRVECSDQADIPVLRSVLKPVAQQVSGPNATLEVKLFKGK